MWYADENSQNSDSNMRPKTYFILHLNGNLRVASLFLFLRISTCSCGMFASMFTCPVPCMIPYEWKQSTVYSLVTLAVLFIISAFKVRPDVIHSLIQSFRSLPYDRSTASSEASSLQCAIQCFHFQFPLSFRFLRVIQWLLTSTSSSSRNFYPFFYLSFNSVVQNAVPTQDVTNTVSLPAFYEELSDLYSLPNIARVVKSIRMRWAGHVALMGEGRGVHRFLVGKPEGKRPLGRPRRRW